MRDNMGIAVVCMVNKTTYSSTFDSELIDVVSNATERPKCKKWSIYSSELVEISPNMVR